MFQFLENATTSLNLKQGVFAISRTAGCVAEGAGICWSEQEANAALQSERRDARSVGSVQLPLRPVVAFFPSSYAVVFCKRNVQSCLWFAQATREVDEKMNPCFCTGEVVRD